MSYYDTIDEDLARAKEILEKGQPSPWEAAQFPPEVTEALRRVGGGIIYGADTYAAYRLLESFVGEIERLRAEVTRALLDGTMKGYTAGENAESKHWRQRAEAAEAEVARLRALVDAVGEKVCELALKQKRRADPS